MAKVQNVVSEKLDTHCGSLKDAIYHTRGVIDSNTKKELVNLNAANSIHKHSTSKSLDDLVLKVEKQIEQIVRADRESVNEQAELGGYIGGNDKYDDNGSRCPGGHSLSPLVPDNPHTCDRCLRVPPPYETLYHCVPCDYSSCADCRLDSDGVDG